MRHTYTDGRVTSPIGASRGRGARNWCAEIVPTIGRSFERLWLSKSTEGYFITAGSRLAIEFGADKILSGGARDARRWYGVVTGERGDGWIEIVRCASGPEAIAVAARTASPTCDDTTDDREVSAPRATKARKVSPVSEPIAYVLSGQAVLEAETRAQDSRPAAEPGSIAQARRIAELESTLHESVADARTWKAVAKAMEEQRDADRESLRIARVHLDTYRVDVARLESEIETWRKLAGDRSAATARGETNTAQRASLLEID